jgi:hypothetical protein
MQAVWQAGMQSMRWNDYDQNDVMLLVAQHPDAIPYFHTSDVCDDPQDILDFFDTWQKTFP